MEEWELSKVITRLGVEEGIFPVKYHPKHAAMKEELHAWAASSLGPAYADNVEELQVAMLGCTFWPHTIATPPRRLLTLLKLMYWLFVIDDIVEESKDRSKEGKALHAQQICNAVLRAIPQRRTPSALRAQALPAHILIALQVLNEMQEDGMSPTQLTRFQSIMTSYLQALTREQLLNSSTPPTLEEFTAICRRAAASFVLATGTEYSLGIELSNEALASPLLQELHNAAGDHMTFVNDIFSFEKEFANKDHFFNLLYLLHTHNNAAGGGGGGVNMPVQFHVAVSQAWEVALRRQRDCASLAQQILSCPHLLASSPGLESYVEGVCFYTASNWFWTTQVDRYKKKPSPPQATLKPFRGNALRSPLPRTGVRRQFGCASVGTPIIQRPFLNKQGVTPRMSPFPFVTHF